MTDTPSSGPVQDRFLPIAIFFLTIVVLFIAPRLWFEFGTLFGHPMSSPSSDLTNLIRVMHDTTVTGPEGNTVSFDEAVKSGWLGVSTIRIDRFTASYRPKGTLAYALANKTTKPLRVLIPSEKGPADPKTVDIPPGDTQQVLTATQGNPTNLKTIMQIVVSIPLLLGGMFVILAKRYQPSDRHWAYATVGTIAGYWLKG